MLKDVRLCLEEARAAGAAFPLAALAGELYAAGAGRGLGDQDFAAVLEVVEDLNDTRVTDGRTVTAPEWCDLQGDFAISRLCA